jgi:ectoine hydroxylase-related dioxygenase (phytanoyl-CoA dioxygenase family)
MELLAGDHDWPASYFQILDPEKYHNPHGGFVPLGVQLPAKQEQVFRDIADHPNLQSIMAQLLAGPVKRFTDQLLIKNKAIRGESFYHQDSDYWHLPPERGANAWIALDEVGPEAIALAVMPGTQKIWQIIPHEEYYDEPSLHSAETGRAFKRFRIPFDQIDFSKEVLLPMSHGDAAIFTNYTWHRADPNLSGSDKAAYAIAYQRAD